MKSECPQNTKKRNGRASNVKVEYCYIGSEKTDILLEKVFDYLVRKALKNDVANLQTLRYTYNNLQTYPHDQKNQHRISNGSRSF